MLSYVLKRILFAIPIVFGVLTITFLLSKVMPRDSVMSLLSRAQIRVTPEIYNSMAHQLGFDQPLYIQYFRYIIDIFSGNWGESVGYAGGSDVWDLILFKLPKTIDPTFFQWLLPLFSELK